MPIYEYECTACGVRFERRQQVSDDPIRVCPTCGAETRRVLHPVGIIFKGSGWYITDNRKGAGSTTESSEGKPATEAAPAKSEKTESKTDAKPATDTSSKT